MLHLETVEPLTFSVLKGVMLMPALEKFSLVGGTALALKYGHRRSVDLDLFSNEKFDVGEVEKALEKEFGALFEYEKTKVTFAVFCEINKIKTDLVHYPHALIAPIEEQDGIRMYSSKDIAAMKINAILGRGVKKDFWDLVELLKVFSMEEIIQFHKQKYPSQMLAISIPNALVYFDDAEHSEDPVSLKNQDWKQIKSDIQTKVRNYLK